MMLGTTNIKCHIKTCSDILNLSTSFALCKFLCLTNIDRFRPNRDNINSFPFSLATNVLLLLTITCQQINRIFIRGICKNTCYEIWKYVGLADGDLGKVDSRHTAHLMS